MEWLKLLKIYIYYIYAKQNEKEMVMEESATTRVKSSQIERCLDRDFYTLIKSLCEEVNKVPKAIHMPGVEPRMFALDSCRLPYQAFLKL